MHRDKDTYRNFFSIYETRGYNGSNVSDPGKRCLAHVLCIHFLCTSASLIAYVFGCVHTHIYAIIITLHFAQTQMQ